MSQLLAPLLAFWSLYAPVLLLGGGLAGVGLLAGMVVWARRTEKPLRPIALAFSMNLALLLNAEGMWVIAIDQLKLPAIFAVLVFAVFEICFLTATSLAAEQYRRTSVYAPDGTIVTPGHPGPMLWIAALIAGLSGIIVASNAATFTEQLLRLAVPCMIFLMWWAALTAAGQKMRRSRFAYSPRRLAERWGLLIPDADADLDRLRADRQVRRMIVAHQRITAGRWPAAWWRSRLQRDARTATDGVVAQVVEQLTRIDTIMTMLAPGGRTPAAPEQHTEGHSPDVSAAGIPAPVVVLSRAARVRHRRSLRQVRTAHPRPPVPPAQEPYVPYRSPQEVDVMVRALRAADPVLSIRQMAILTALPPGRIRSSLDRTRPGQKARPTNGNNVLAGAQ